MPRPAGHNELTARGIQIARGNVLMGDQMDFLVGTTTSLSRVASVGDSQCQHDRGCCKMLAILVAESELSVTIFTSALP